MKWFYFLVNIQKPGANLQNQEAFHLGLNRHYFYDFCSREKLCEYIARSKSFH